MARLIALAACLALCLAAPAAGDPSRAADCPATVAGRLDLSEPTTQLVTVLVARPSSTRGSLRRWRRAGGCWRPVGDPVPAWVGKRGVSADRREGDRTTPAGVFAFGRVMYGVAPNPGVRYPYRRVVCGDWWVEDPRSPDYNRLRHVRCGTRPPFKVSSGDLSESPTAYRHFAVIGFNVDPVVPGRGSGIFLHASIGKPTSGCVSLPLTELVRVLRWLQPPSTPRIAIGTASQLRRAG